MSHFLSPDSDKKKKCFGKHFFRTFFFAPPRRARSRSGRASERRHNPPEPPPPARGGCAASPKLFFFLGELSPCLRMGFRGVVPRLRRSLPRRAKRGNRARGSDARGFLFAYPYFRYAPRGNAADSFSANEKSAPAGTQPRRERFSLSEKKKIISFSFR